MKMRSVLLTSAGLAAAVAGAAGTAFGAGFYLPEVGSPASLGTAGVANPTNTYSAGAIDYADLTWVLGPMYVASQ